MKTARHCPRPAIDPVSGHYSWPNPAVFFLVYYSVTNLLRGGQLVRSFGHVNAPRTRTLRTSKASPPVPLKKQNWTYTIARAQFIGASRKFVLDFGLMAGKGGQMRITGRCEGLPPDVPRSRGIVKRSKKDSACAKQVPSLDGLS